MKSFVNICSKKIFVILSLCLSFSSFAKEVYTVQAGDTLYSISRKFSIDVTVLREANGISSNNVIYKGQKLTIPDGKDTAKAEEVKDNVTVRSYDLYTVQKGDTFYNIAKVNAMTVSELKALNDLSDDSVLKAGQKLKIPVTKAAAQAPLPDLPATDPRKYSTKKGDTSLTWPVKATEVVYTQGKVSGVQLSSAKDENVKCIRAGLVMYTGVYRGYGNVVFVQAKAGYIYAYAGLSSINVRKGDYVVFDTILGTAGTDILKGTSLINFMVFKDSSPIDPAKAPRG